jgi:thiol-disulfide isomerase/thioredoxin
MRFLSAAAALFALTACALAPLMALEVGEKAPSLENVAWMKGQPVTIGSAVTVVEFWATWCGPCIKGIPHLTELQKKYDSKVNIVGISNEDEATVKPFIEKMGDKMEYHVGITDKTSYRAYMEGIGGIPHAFLVDTSGTVVWHGHPATIDGPLSQVVAGTFDHAKSSAIGKAENEIQQLLSGQSPNIRSALTKIDELFALDPANGIAVSMSLAIGKHQKNPKLIRDTLTRLTTIDAPADLTNSLALSCANNDDLPNRNLDVAFTLIDRALKSEPGNASFLDTKARLLAAVGLMDRAIAVQQDAVSKKPDDASLAKTLAYYQSTKKLAASLSDDSAHPTDTVPAAIP